MIFKNFILGLIGLSWVGYYFYLFVLRTRITHSIVPLTFGDSSSWILLITTILFVIINGIGLYYYLIIAPAENWVTKKLSKFADVMFNDPLEVLNFYLIPLLPFSGEILLFFGGIIYKYHKSLYKKSLRLVMIYLFFIPRAFLGMFFFINIILMEKFNFFIIPLVILGIWMLFFRVMREIILVWASRNLGVYLACFELKLVNNQYMLVVRDGFADVPNDILLAYTRQWDFFNACFELMVYSKEFDNEIAYPYFSIILRSIYFTGTLKICLIYLGIIYPVGFYIWICLYIIIIVSIKTKK